MKKSVRLYVTGTVQGVFFREFVKENAERHNTKGFVRNLEDGRVEVFLEGDNNNVDKMIETCKQIPNHRLCQCLKQVCLPCKAGGFAQGMLSCRNILFQNNLSRLLLIPQQALRRTSFQILLSCRTLPIIR